MKTYLAFITIALATFYISSCKNNVQIKIDKNPIQVGETITARLYVDNMDGFLPAFSIVRNQDTLRLPIDTTDNDCGVFRGRFKETGVRDNKGFVEFFNKKNRKQRYEFTFKFKVVASEQINKTDK